MAKVSLRIYNREIESMIDQGRIEESVAHCHHILKTFPKHLETYRLLGKAYLETKRYNDAADIFLRVLMAVPDDFVSHVGMSLIRDENQSMDAAIWHMERAFESRPSNAAVQGELQRLYGRRDGVEPPKVRMTRGALANMYVQGELYPQAIGEIQGVFSKDPDRVDMQVLLAKAYFYSGQKVEASEICSNLLNKYPYCLDANRILLEILPETGRAENTHVYRHRVNSLEPYAAFAKGSVFQSDEVPDASVNLERLEWQPGQDEGLESDWGDTMGIKLDEDADVQPDWLKSGTPESDSDFGPATAQEISPAVEEIPDFMREAGWGESSGEAEDPSFSSMDESEEDIEIEQGEMPDWMKSMAPSGAALAAESRDSDETETGDTMADDWIDDLLGEKDEGDQPLEDAPKPPSEGVSDSIGDLGTSADDQDAAMNWLESLAAKQGAKSEELITDPNARTEDAPEWVQQAQDAVSGETPPSAADADESLVAGADAIGDETAPSEESPIGDLGTSADDQDAAMNWLENLAAKQGAKPEELITDPDERTADVPEWVEEAKAMVDEETPTVPAEEPVAPRDDSLEALGISAETEATMPDLSAFEEAESAEEPVTPSDDNLEALGISAEPEEVPMPDLAAFEEVTPKKELAPEVSDEPIDDGGAVPDWLQEMEAKSGEAQPVEEEAAPADDVDLPTWLHDMEDSPASEETGLTEDDLPAWLKEEETVPPEPQPTQPTEWKPTEEISEPAPVEAEPIAPPPASVEPAPAEAEPIAPPPTPVESVPAEAEPIAPPPAPVESAPVEAEPVAPPPAPVVSAPEPVSPPPERPKSVRKKSKRMSTTMLKDEILSVAQVALNDGNIPAALEEYAKLIKKNRLLDETIYDLREALYQYPVDVSIWQTLGDAYMRANRLQDALDAYTKAEELLR